MVKFPELGCESEKVLQELEQICQSDFSYQDGTIFNSICTSPLPIAVKVYNKYIHTNLGDNRLFPGAKNIEKKTVALLADLLKGQDAVGSIVSGGTEANLLALIAATRNQKKSTDSPEVVVSENIHFSVQKAAKFLRVKLVFCGLDRNFRANVQLIKQAINRNTVAIMVTAGTSDLGIIDPIAEIAEIALENDLYLHVDAATGGFIIPFAKSNGCELPDFDFSLNGVASITIDPHKYGFSVIPAGCILFRNADYLEYLRISSYFLGTHDHFTLIGTRNGASALATYAVCRFLGWQGFKDKIAEIYKKRDFFIDLIIKSGLSLFVGPQLPIVGINSRNPVAVLAELEKAGYIISVSKQHKFIRIVIQDHQNYDQLANLAQKISNAEKNL